jgi:hypothetical protein
MFLLSRHPDSFLLSHNYRTLTQVVFEYLLKWKGYGHEFNMWYSEDELTNQALHPRLPVKKRGRPSKAKEKSPAHLALVNHLYT